jgi:primosomal protein N' (replication factor Y)
VDRFAAVVVPLPLGGALTYRLPPDAAVQAGARVLVPLGSRRVTGCVVSVDASLDSTFDPARLRDVIEILDDEPFFPSDIVDLCRWVAGYYLCGVGDALAAASPPFTWRATRPTVRLSDAGRRRLVDDAGGDVIEGLVLRTVAEAPVRGLPALIARVSRRRGGRAELRVGADPGQVGRVVRRLAREGYLALSPELDGRERGFRTKRLVRLAQGESPSSRLTARQRAALAALDAAGGLAWLQAMVGRGHSAAVIGRLERHGLVVVELAREERDPFAAGAWHDETQQVEDAAPLSLTGEQEAALARLSALADEGAFRVAVLHGVTGSGKTELYLRLAERAQAQGRRSLVLVPEIALTPAIAGRFRARFGPRVAVQHSGLSDGERHDQWHRIRRGDVDVVVGTRSAVFAPLPALGVVIVDEEHDTSYKQEETPRYHGRDVALVRAKQAGALAVLGSATPSLESFQHASVGRYTLVRLERRVHDRPLADVRLVDMRREYAERGPDVVLSTALAGALEDRMRRREQAVVLLNRRGYAASLLCRSCGHVAGCPHCSVTLTVHRGARRARCHYCDYVIALPDTCESCGGGIIEYQGVGTERVEAELVALLPGARIARVDRDSIRRRGAIAALLARFARRELDVLVGTQMIAKGHDFPQVTLVGVISADIGLGVADFRASERTFQLLTQVAGRAGRGSQPGEAIVQTVNPGHYGIALARAQDYDAFYVHELEYRQSMRYPPVVSMINLVFRAPSMREALVAARQAVRAMSPVPDQVRLLGPAPAPLTKLRDEHRVQLFLKGTDRATMRALVRQIFERHPSMRRQTVVDVDPLMVL